MSSTPTPDNARGGDLAFAIESIIAIDERLERLPPGDEAIDELNRRRGGAPARSDGTAGHEWMEAAGIVGELTDLRETLVALAAQQVPVMPSGPDEDDGILLAARVGTVESLLRLHRSIRGDVNDYSIEPADD